MDRLARAGQICRPPILLTAQDREQVAALLRDAVPTLEPELALFLGEEIERAETAPENAISLMVGLGCEVKFIDHRAQRMRAGTLVRPDQVAGERCISVLSPIGSALIGLGPGQSIAWAHRGVTHALTVLEVRRGP